MKAFEIGKRYYESGVTYEIIKKTAKTVTYKAIQHAGNVFPVSDDGRPLSVSKR